MDVYIIICKINRFICVRVCVCVCEYVHVCVDAAYIVDVVLSKSRLTWGAPLRALSIRSMFCAFGCAYVYIDWVIVHITTRVYKILSVLDVVLVEQSRISAVWRERREYKKHIHKAKLYYIGCEIVHRVREH